MNKEKVAVELSAMRWHACTLKAVLSAPSSRSKLDPVHFVVRELSTMGFTVKV
jgi:hypothetical protein